VIHDDKYIVIKRDDAEHMKVNVPGGTLLDAIQYSELALPDAVVIRTQDFFSYTGLTAYATEIDSFIELVRSGMVPVSSKLDIGRLEQIRDYFHGEAGIAHDRLARGEAKLPD
jgi:hypothetical protein